MNSPNPLARITLATRFSIDTRLNNRPTPASSCPSHSPSSANASPLKPCDRPFPGPSISPCDRSIPSLSQCDRPNHSLTFASESFAPRVRPTASLSQDFRQSFSLCDRPFSGSIFGPCDHSPLPKCKTLSLRQGSAKRSACLHLSQKLKRLARPSRILQRYDLGFLWGLWLMVAVQNMIRYSPQRMPSAERSFIASSPTPAAGATA
jgi:hypothetical protein